MSYFRKIEDTTEICSFMSMLMNRVSIRAGDNVKTAELTDHFPDFIGLWFAPKIKEILRKNNYSIENNRISNPINHDVLSLELKNLRCSIFRVVYDAYHPPDDGVIELEMYYANKEAEDLLLKFITKDYTIEYMKSRLALFEEGHLMYVQEKSVLAKISKMLAEYDSDNDIQELRKKMDRALSALIWSY